MTMTEYSYQNQITFAYSGRPLAIKELGDTLEFQFARCQREPGSFQEECYHVARLISQKAAAQGRDVYVLQSGGMDSEVVLKSFLDQGLPVKSIMFLYTEGKSRHEEVFADYFSKRHGVPILKHMIDPFTWMPAQHELFTRTYSASAFVLSHMEVMSRVWDELNGLPVLGCGDVLFHQEEGRWMFFRQEATTIPWYWHLKNEGIDGVCGFFHYTPEIQLAMLREPRMRAIGLNKNKAAALFNSARQDKYIIYRRIWPDLSTRPKYTGQEFIYDFAADLQRGWNDQREITYFGSWSCTYEDIIAALDPSNG